MRFAPAIAVGWALLLAISAGKTYAFVVRPQLPRFVRDEPAASGSRSLRCGATSGLIEVHDDVRYMLVDSDIEFLCVRPIYSGRQSAPLGICGRI